MLDLPRWRPVTPDSDDDTEPQGDDLILMPDLVESALGRMDSKRNERLRPGTCVDVFGTHRVSLGHREKVRLFTIF